MTVARNNLEQFEPLETTMADNNSGTGHTKGGGFFGKMITGIRTVGGVLGYAFILMAGVNVVEGYQKRQEEKKRDMQRMLDKHADYSSCMTQLSAWNRQFQDGADDEERKKKWKARAGQTFKEKLEKDDGQAKQVNLCRSKAKDFWREMDVLIERYGPGFEKTSPFNTAHRARFVDTVQHLDVLDAYACHDDRVYQKKVES